MKKIFIALFALFLGLQVNAATTSTNWDSATAQKRLNNIAYKIIKSNSLPSGISVKVSNDENANAYANINKEIYVIKNDQKELVDCIGINEEGNLIIKNKDGKLEEIMSGEVSIRGVKGYV